ncbi:MAG: TonB-dependent receptor plug domain-containing protein, partial [Synergistaceae bacterium]|nr:TonB-dependent receptor plug domain-containing protein [Synergistaceae bacterium]
MNLINLKELESYSFLKKIVSSGKIIAMCMLLLSISLSAVASTANVEFSTETVKIVEQANKITVSGVIFDEYNDPVIGANISELGTTNGTISDLDGKWTLIVAKGSSIQISYIGYLTETIKAVDSKEIITTLKEDNQALEEVVVVGYGSVKKSNLTGSVSKISEESMKDRPIATLGEAFQGQLAGVTSAASGGGVPGSELSIRIRGVNTINGTSNPLYVVDGVPRDNMSDINPSDIASIQVLKDASSTAIYGSRGASGVILIETKQGKGKPSFTFDAYYGFQNAERKMDLMVGPEYVAQVMYIRNVNHLRDGGSMKDPMSARKADNQIPDWW